ncbi:three-helix bundle dimerization domain-containing protein [Microbacterium sp. BR1]|uniref:three-helix bundle dimerization domain-containing protein n=1 Tax=Microbacterium sp. BR1 TaxID=1070896 RepID=UPI003FA530B9
MCGCGALPLNVLLPERDAVEYARTSFSGATGRNFVPVLIEKETKARLKGRR